MTQIFEMIGIFFLIVFIAIGAFVDGLTPYRFIDDGDPLEARIELVEIDGEFTYGDEDRLEEKVRRVAVIEDKATFIEELKRLKNTRPFGDPADIGATGKAIMLIYPNGDVELIGTFGTTWIANGEMKIYYSMFDEESYLAFWEKWADMTDAVPA
ncbi:MAG: hypothetical protein J6W14_07735 [Clostridia bacterium]|nr:hypothetical protein [Clostridia bacterium]